MPIEYLNPPTLPRNPAFTQAVKVTAGTPLVFIGGQNGVDENGEVVSDQVDDQTVRALRNVELAVEAAGGTLSDIVKWTIIVTDTDALGPGFAAFQQAWGRKPNPPAITVQVVTALANPAFLVEIEAIAALP
jgi:enamine deaminase RidA (YjgF/YER057c/UK114 family)